MIIKTGLDYFPIVDSKSLLSSTERAGLMNQFSLLFSFLEKEYERFYEPLIQRFVSYAQNLPETEFSYFSARGGFIDLALKRTFLASSHYKSYLFPQRISADLVTDEIALWMFLVFSGSLLFEVGKLYTKYKVNLCDTHGKVIETWNPFAGNMKSIKDAVNYQFTFENKISIDLLHRSTFLLARQIMTDEGFTKISKDPTAFSTWLSILIGDLRQVGALTSIIPQANAQVIAEYFERKLLDERVQIKKEREDNQKEISPDDPKKETLVSRMKFISMQIPKTPDAANQTQFALGFEFLKWLQVKVENGTARMNQSNGLVLETANGHLITEKAFAAFASERNMNASNVQDALVSLQITEKNANGGDIHSVDLAAIGRNMASPIVTARSQEQRGILLGNPNFLLPLEISAISADAARISIQNMPGPLPVIPPQNTLQK